MAFRNLESNAPLVKREWLAQELYRGERTSGLPDLFVEWNPMRRSHELVHRMPVLSRRPTQVVVRAITWSKAFS